MKSSHKDGMQDRVSFFTALRRLGREVDQGVKDIQKQLDGRQAACDNNRHLALKGLLERRKEVDTLKSESRTLMSEMRHGGKDFEQSLQACTEIVDIQLQQLSTIQAHLTQYGFVPQSECEDSTEEGLEKTSTTEEMESPTTPPQQKDIREEVEKKSKLTPCLEDFGVSSYTLNMLNRPIQQPSYKFAKPPSPLPDSACGRHPLRSEVSRHDSVPTPFQNQGLTVTPSLFPSKSYGSGMRSPQEVFSMAYSPDMVGRGAQEPPDQDSDLQDRQIEVARTLDFSDSPFPPLLQTPGIKQIPPLRQAILPPPGERGPVARQLKLGGSERDDGLDSPIPPVLSTPGIQQIGGKTRSVCSEAHKTKQAPVGGYNPLELPKTPELTYSLKDLEEMTVSFRQGDLSSTFSDRPANNTSDLDMTGFTQAITHKDHQDRNMSPPALQPPRQAAGPSLSYRMESDRITSSRMELDRMGSHRMESDRMGSDRTASNRMELDRMGSHRMESDRVGSDRMGSDRTASNRMESDRMGSHRMESDGMGSDRMGSVRMVSDRVVSDRMGSYKMASDLVSEPQLSMWSSERVDAGGLDLPPSPELTMCYFTRPHSTTVSTRSDSSLISHNRTASSRFDVDKQGQSDNYIGKEPFMSASSFSMHQSQTERPFIVENEDHYESVLDKSKRSCMSSARSGFQSSYSVKATATAHGMDSRVLRSTENTTSTHTPESYRKADMGVLKGPSLPEQPVLHHSVTDGGLDLPATPKFLGSYHFMGSKH